MGESWDNHKHAANAMRRQERESREETSRRLARMELLESLVKAANENPHLARELDEALRGRGMSIRGVCPDPEFCDGDCAGRCP